MASDDPQALMLRLTDIRYLARDTNLFTFERPDGGVLPATEPGAHIGIILPSGYERQYSLTCAEPSPRRYSVAVKRDANGRGGSIAMHDTLRVGALVQIAPPRNNFPLSGTGQIVLIAGGIGITPVWCMVQALSEQQRDFSLHYACRSREDAAFLKALEAGGHTRFHFDDESGRVLDVAAIVAAAPKDAHLYCCGPSPMLTAFETATADWPAAQIHVEYFTPKYEKDLSGGYVVELARSGMVLEVPPGETILEVVRAAGIEVATSCEEGVCGSCETRVISGVPDHRDVILSKEERAESKTMFICCSGSLSERLVLDL
jgi:ferredoxin-NADP reductase